MQFWLAEKKASKMRLTRILCQDIRKLILRYSRYQQSCLSIEQYTSFGRRGKSVDSFLFGRNEIPVRLAHIIREIDLLPKNLLRTPSVELVRSWYVQSFKELVEFQDENENEETVERFTSSLAHIKHRHDNVVETMAQGIIELRQREGDTAFQNPSIQYFLDRFYMNRIAVRMLITQHLILFREDARSSKSNFVGCFDPRCNVVSIVQDAAGNASFLCDQVYCGSPNVEVTEYNSIQHGQPVTFAYVPGHLYHMLFELLKNAMRAVMECHGVSIDPPDINVLVTKGKEDLTIKISDRGGGIPKSKLEQLFEYHYTTAPEPMRAGTAAPLAGYGYGLPLSRLYAKYFDGDIQLYSMEGYGTDAVIYLKAVEEDSIEVLPVYNARTPKNYEHVEQSGMHVKDWSSSTFYGGQSYGRHAANYYAHRKLHIARRKNKLDSQKVLKAPAIHE